MSKFIQMMKDESGASAAEYALILAVVGLGIVLAGVYLGGTVGNAMSCAGKTIESKASTC